MNGNINKLHSIFWKYYIYFVEPFDLIAFCGLQILVFIAGMPHSCRNDQDEGFYDEFFADSTSEESSDWDEHEVLPDPIR